MGRFYKTARLLWMFGLILITIVSFYYPFEEQYKPENAQERYIYKPDIHHSAAVLKPSQILSKLKVTSSVIPAFLTISAAYILKPPKFRLPYRPIIPLRLRLLMLSPIKYTSTYVSFLSASANHVMVPLGNRNH